MNTIRRIALGAAAGALVLTSGVLPATVLAQSAPAAEPALVDLVNPLMGTDSEFALSYGNTYPAVAVPWGMNFWTPVTGTLTTE